jgi:hypothetical protein
MVARRENTKINYKVDNRGKKKKRTSKIKRGWKVYQQPSKQDKAEQCGKVFKWVILVVCIKII